MRERIIRELREAAAQSRVRPGALGATCAIGSATSRSAPSTRSACRCSGSSRSRRTSTRASRWPTRPRCRARGRGARPRAADHCRAGARRSGRGAGARATRGSATRQGLAALLDRRLVAWDALDRFLEKRPRGPDGRVVCRRAAGAAGRACAAVPGGLPAFLADGPVRSPAVPAPGARPRSGLPSSSGPATPELRSLLDRVPRTSSRQDGAPRRSGGIRPYKAAHYPSARRRGGTGRPSTRSRRTSSGWCSPSRAISTSCWRAASGGCSPSRSRSTAGARRAIGPGFLRRAPARARAAAADGRVLAEPLPPRVAVPPRARGRVPGHEPRAVGAGLAARQSWGEGPRARLQPLDLHRRRSQAVDLSLSRRRSRRDARGGALHRGAAAGWRLAPGDQPQLRALPELLDFVNDSSARCRRPGCRSDDFTYEADRSPTDRRPAGPRRPCSESRRGGSGRLRARGRGRISRARGGDGARSPDRRVARQARPGDIAILFRSRASHREFERELELRGIPTYVYKGLGFFDADEIKDVTALLRYLADPASTCGRRRCCGRGSSACRTRARGWPRLACAARRRSACAALARSTRKIADVLGTCVSTCPRLDCPRWIACRPRS
jgi:hypothetical protein